MKTRIPLTLLVIALLLSLSGCPGTVTIKYGVWIFSIVTYPSPTPSEAALSLVQHGFTDVPPVGYPSTMGVFGGTMTWQQNGSNISFLLDSMTNDYLYTGTVASSTSMSGSWNKVGDPLVLGTWSAEWDPES